MLKTKIFRKKWYNFQLPATISEIYMIFEIFKQRGFPHLRQFVESPFIFVHIIALDILENSSGRKLEAARLSPRPRMTWAEYWCWHKLALLEHIFLFPKAF